MLVVLVMVSVVLIWALARFWCGCRGSGVGLGGSGVGVGGSGEC